MNSLVERVSDGQFAFSFVIELERIRDEVVRRMEAPNPPRMSFGMLGN
jgi:hypothetical protein